MRNNTEIAYIYSLVDPREEEIVRYVGKSVCPKSRLRDHIKDYKKTNYRSSTWIKSIIREGVLPKMKILKICPLSEYEINERFFVQKYKSDKLTNSDESGQGHTERKRELIENANYNRKPVYQYDIDGSFIKKFKSARDAGRKLNINHSHIIRCCNFIIKHTHCYIFSYTKKKVNPIKNPNAVKKSVIEIDIDGNKKNRWDSLMDCSRSVGIDNGNISRVCNGKVKSIKGRFFKFQ